MDELIAKNREALFAWHVRRNYCKQNLVEFQAPWPRMQMACFAREYLEKRLAARRWLAAHSEDFRRLIRANVVDFIQFTRGRRGY